MPRSQKTAQKAQAQTEASTATKTEQTAQAERTTQTEQPAQVERLRPISMTFAPGNLLWNDNDMNGNVAGIASIAYATVFMLEAVADNKASEAEIKEIKKVLEYIGGSEKVKEFRDKLQQRAGMSVSDTTPFNNLFNVGC